MSAYSKGLIGAAALILGSTATVIGVSSKTSWNRNNPVAKDWLRENNFSRKEDKKIADFESRTLDDYFGLGCHRVIYGGQNFRKLYKDSSIATGPVKGAPSNSSLPISVSDLFTDTNEPFLGCSTAFKRTSNSKNIYEYEVSLRQGERGFAERISVYTDKIVSQLVFYEQKPQTDLSKKPEYKHLFGLYRYIKQNHESSGTKIYKIAKPTDSGTIWSELDLSSTSLENTARYYSFWVDDSNGKGLLDDLGVKSNEKLFSSVIKDQDSSDANTSNFVYVNSRSQNQTLQASESPSAYYDLSVLDSLVNKLHKKKGFWKSATEFCSKELSDDERQNILEIKRLSQYCYEVKKEPTKATGQ